MTSVFFITLYKFVPVYYTPLMAIRSLDHIGDDKFSTRKTWKPLSEISRNMAMAVMAAEDTRFIDHSGFDWEELDHAVAEHKKGKRLRGASTISQQTAKNVFLWPSRSWLRKGLEVYFTFGIELIWGKKRILEVYLNVAEMGPGIYGVEAASQFYYKKPAARLSAREAAQIAATLPNPLKRTPTRMTSYMQKYTDTILLRMTQIAVPLWLHK